VSLLLLFSFELKKNGAIQKGGRSPALLELDQSQNDPWIDLMSTVASKLVASIPAEKPEHFNQEQSFSLQYCNNQNYLIIDH
jgi:hypothetical protein